MYLYGKGLISEEKTEGSTDDNGLYYMRQRYYNPEIKRFINQDVVIGNIIDPLSLNRYAYVQGNPISYTDPFGLSPVSASFDGLGFAHLVLGFFEGVPVISIFADCADAILYAYFDQDMDKAWQHIGGAIWDTAGTLSGAVVDGVKIKRAAEYAEQIYKLSSKGIDLYNNVKTFVPTAVDVYQKIKSDNFQLNFENAAEMYTLMSSGSGILSDIGDMTSGAKEINKMLKDDEAARAKINAMLKSGGQMTQPGAISKYAHYQNPVDNPQFEAIHDNGAPASCCNGSNGCFVAGTQVKTGDGDRNIEEIQPGDEVYAYNFATGEAELKKVRSVTVHDADELVHVTVEGENAESVDSAGDSIVCTTNHPFYVEGIGFVPAGDLQPGDNIMLLDGSSRKIESIEHEFQATSVKVYNFEVEDLHTYYVGVQGVLVHNTCPRKTSYGKSSGKSGADNIADAAKLKEYYKQAEKYGTGSIKELENGRFRFYEELKPARTQGKMAGARHVREWDPYTGLKRDWYETLDYNGIIRQVRPDPNITGGVKVHYMFDAEGNYIGNWIPKK